MREKLLYAINTCKEIDTDFVVSDASVARNTAEDEATNEEVTKETDSVCITQ
jgi:hypothetical protein